MIIQIEHPLVTRICEMGVKRNDKIIDFCYFCGKEIYEFEEYAIVGQLAVCSDFDCREAAFMANADDMLIQFSDDWEQRSDAIAWYFQTHCKEIRDER